MIIRLHFMVSCLFVSFFACCLVILYNFSFLRFSLSRVDRFFLGFFFVCVGRVLLLLHCGTLASILLFVVIVWLGFGKC